MQTALKTKEIDLTLSYKKEKYLTSLPQANDFTQIVELVNCFKRKKFLTHSQIQAELDIHETHLYYYLHAATQLKLLDFTLGENNSYIYTLTPDTSEMLSKHKKDQTLFYIRKIMAYPVCKQIINTYMDQIKIPSIQEIARIVRKHNKNVALADTTILRRISSLTSWSRWAVQNMRSVF